ncbi:SDR family oxidoreductase, partial [Streptomyces sp. NPDC059627]
APARPPPPAPRAPGPAAGPGGVVVSDTDLEGAEMVAAGIGADALAVRADVADEASIQALVDRARERFGSVDIFVSNAGLTVTGSYDASDEDWKRALDVNMMSHVWAARAVVPAMLEAGRGHLVQTIAACGVLTAFGAAPYSVAKQGAVAWAAEPPREVWPPPRGGSWRVAPPRD